MPCSLQNENSAGSVQYGFNSTWLSTGLTLAEETRERSCGAVKLETPMERARPARWTFSNAAQTSGMLGEFGGKEGVWIRNRST